MYVKEGLSLQVPQQQGDVFTLLGICTGRTTVLKVMRRFGCAFTRYEAQENSRAKEEFRKMGVSLVAVGFDTVGAASFVMGDYWGGELYLDKRRDLYDFFKLHRIGKFSAMKCMVNKETRKLYSLAKEKCKGNLAGDRFQLGGTFVIGRTGRVLFSHVQQNFVDFSPMEDVIDVCKREILERALLNRMSTRRVSIHSDVRKPRTKSIFKGPHFKKRKSVIVPQKDVPVIDESFMTINSAIMPLPFEDNDIYSTALTSIQTDILQSPVETIFSVNSMISPQVPSQLTTNAICFYSKRRNQNSSTFSELSEIVLDVSADLEPIKSNSLVPSPIPRSPNETYIPAPLAILDALVISDTSQPVFSNIPSSPIPHSFHEKSDSASSSIFDKLVAPDTIENLSTDIQTLRPFHT